MITQEHEDAKPLPKQESKARVRLGDWRQYRADILNTAVLQSSVSMNFSTVLPEKLKRPQLLKKFRAFYGTPRFITVFTNARHLSLS